ncbi:sterol desaturase family protein [Undibacterium sp. 5I1]|uniref:sterol desaturase family protein n=1 Tax=unclassified Undibacterium TaxID=2630295 RepID=UPI002AB3D81A|nr:MULTISPECIES: sterol desaturase family protein [unclassified Undibacterium]MDY7539262.1 sterol desaturase family protein [Undibacterium sp. 5I1]MEB0231720.1 sterol desaturase family protein [Undibacterium sp. 10I3]MEB0256938.1 sterol desaturase family protein [Undibacterium sp. 5I1]
MQEKIITFASPVFFLLIAIEFIVARRRQRHLYRINDAINSLSLGVMSQIIGVFLKVLAIGIYAWVAQHFALFDLSDNSVWVWVSGLLLYDFLYYWLHRMGHETNLLWAAHVVHHQSESYNLTTALRQTSSGALFGWIFYLPMAVLGFPVHVFIIIALIDLLYQFWIHTEQIDKMGWFDRVFVSPSNHRAHHGVNDLYLDKNYGGILILWDRLFGTFIEEQDAHPVVFGTRSPLRSWNPLWANVEVYKAVASDAWHTQNWWDKCRIWFMPPGWRPADIVATSPAKSFDLQRPEFNPPLTGTKMWYCLVQFVITLQAGTHFLTIAPNTAFSSLLPYAIWLVAGLWIVGGLMEQQKLYIKLEAVRLLATLLMVLIGGTWFALVSLTFIAQIAIASTCIISLAALWLIFKK